MVTVTFDSVATVDSWAGALRTSWRLFDPDGQHELALIAVDNRSGDTTLESLRAWSPFVTTIRRTTNRGFAAGCNIGVANLEEDELLVILNPDVEVRDDFFARAASLQWPEDLAARGPLVIGADGRVEQSARAFPTASTGLVGRTSIISRLSPSSRWVRQQLKAVPEAGPRPVDWISGACMIIPASRWAEVGPMDEKYFLYWEDADWCRRARDAGLHVMYEPGVVVHHRQGSSSRSRPYASILAFHLSAFRYYRTHSAQGLRLATVGAAAALGIRAVVKLLTSTLHSLVHSGNARSSTDVTPGAARTLTSANRHHDPLSTAPTEIRSVAIVIVTWNGVEDTLSCLRSVADSDWPELHVIVADNGSSDGTPTLLRNADLAGLVIENGQNLGYAEGTNVGIRAAVATGADAIMLLNNDTIVPFDTVRKLVHVLNERPRAGACSPLITFASDPNRAWFAGSPFDPKRVRAGRPSDYEKGGRPLPIQAFPIDRITGAAALIRRQVFDEIGILDPDLFYLYEDVDLSLRTRKAGWALLLVPQATVAHKVAASQGGHAVTPTTAYYGTRNDLEVARRHATLGRVRGPARQAGCVLVHFAQVRKARRGTRLAVFRATVAGAVDYRRRRFGPWLTNRT